MLNNFQGLTRKGLKMMSKEKVITIKVVGNFKPYDLESKIIQNGVPDASDKPQLVKGTEAVSGFQKLVTWLTQNLAI
jgi:hypothetical protein